MTAWRESSMVYEAADGSKLPFLVFEPTEGTRPTVGIVLFHGGALRKGTANTLAPHCRELASRGILAVSAGYRLLDQGAASIHDCVADARRAVDHFTTLAASRGLPASALVSGGSSAGAHLALVAAMTAEDGSVPPHEPGVAAVVTFNPAGMDLCAFPPELQRTIEQRAGIAEGRAIDFSVIEFVRPGSPHLLIHRRHRRRDRADRPRTSIQGCDGAGRQRVHAARIRTRQARVPPPWRRQSFRRRHRSHGPVPPGPDRSGSRLTEVQVAQPGDDGSMVDDLAIDVQDELPQRPVGVFAFGGAAGAR